ncbi:MAG TPA: hypothetical protein VEK08_02765 [Planctomycetota bacterium]|nr:hypothetical protein [Planctomycetota bacterium]
MVRTLSVLLFLSVSALCAGGETAALVQERDPFLGAPLPQNVVYESKNGWKFEDDTLVFKNPNSNADGKRYLIWKEYHFVIADNEITVLDPRPFGTILTAARTGNDKKGRPLSEKKIMDELKDQAGELRRAREPIAAPPPVQIGIGWGIGWGWHGHRYCPPTHGWSHRRRR